MGPILGLSSRQGIRFLDCSHRANKGLEAKGPNFLDLSHGLRGFFRPIPIRKVSDDLSREDLGLSGLTTLKVSLNN